MYIEFIDLLRCPQPHEDSWLVAAFDAMRGRFIVRGSLGCPVCGNRYAIIDGVAMLIPDDPAQALAPGTDEVRGDDSEEAVRAAAMLSLTQPGALVVLSGDCCRLASALSELAEARVLAVNPNVGIEETEGLGVLRCEGVIPIAPRAADGLMLDISDPAVLSAAAKTLKNGGRIVLPAGTALPPGFRQLATDDKYVVGERIPDLISLSRQ
ncbi:MAG: hypothetical protein H0U59_05685 [Gemmatimonadaceae bacterium]|nr:hypothetical protein [Gemmatimonadaceae bacterium]